MAKKTAPPTRKNRTVTTYKATEAVFNVETVPFKYGTKIDNQSFCIVTTNLEVSGVDDVLETILDGKYSFYTSWNDPEIAMDYDVFVTKGAKAGDGLMPYHEKMFNEHVVKRVGKMQAAFKKQHPVE